MSFYENYIKLCLNKGVSPTKAAVDIGLSNAAAAGWKKGKVPYETTLKKLADYFGCSVSDLTGEKEPTHDSVSGSLRTSFYDSLESMSKEELLDVLAAVTDKLRQRSDS